MNSYKDRIIWNPMMENGTPQAKPLTEQERADGPPADYIRGRCPACGDDLVANLYYVGGNGYMLIWECWQSMMPDSSTCSYRRIL